MKYTYKKIYAEVPAQTGMMQALSIINKAMNGIRPDEAELNGYSNVFVGGTFYPESGNLEETDLNLTNYEIIYRNRDYNRAFVNSFMGFFGDGPLPDSEYIGNWTKDVDDNAHIYYIIDGNTIRKFIMTRAQEMSFTNMNGASDIQFIVNIDGKMCDCFLEDGDLLFTDYDEAEQYLMDLKNKYKKETKQG